MANTKQILTAIIRDKRGYVLSIGTNSYTKTHPLQAHYANKSQLPEKVYLHAEIDAIAKCRDLSKAYSIEVIRVNNEGKYLLSAPCPICRSAISSTGIKKVIYYE
jgi:deoxycytidylate deaminase